MTKNQEKTALQKTLGTAHFLIGAAENHNPEQAIAMTLVLVQMRFLHSNRAEFWKRSMTAVEALLEVYTSQAEKLGKQIAIESDAKTVGGLRRKKARVERLGRQFLAIHKVATRLGDEKAPPLMVEQLANGKLVLERPTEAAERLWTSFFATAARTQDKDYVLANADLVAKPIIEAGLKQEAEWRKRFLNLLVEVFDFDPSILDEEEEEEEPEMEAKDEEIEEDDAESDE